MDVLVEKDYDKLLREALINYYEIDNYNLEDGDYTIISDDDGREYHYCNGKIIFYNGVNYMVLVRSGVREAIRSDINDVVVEEINKCITIDGVFISHLGSGNFMLKVGSESNNVGVIVEEGEVIPKNGGLFKEWFSSKYESQIDYLTTFYSSGSSRDSIMTSYNTSFNQGRMISMSELSDDYELSVSLSDYLRQIIGEVISDGCSYI